MNKHGWTYKRLEDVCDFTRGLTYKGKDEVDYSSNVVLRSNNVDLATYTLNLDELKYIAEDISIPEDKFVKKNSLLICMSNGSKQHLGKVAFIDRDYPYAFGGFMGLIKPIETEIFPKYVYYYCCSPKYKSFLLTIGNGANINNLRFSDIGKNQLPVPSMEEQVAIVAELDEINEAITDLQQQVTDLDNLTQSTFYDMFGDPETNPKGWDVKKIGDICTLKSGDSSANNSKEGNLPYVKVADMNLAENADYILTSSKFVDREQNQRGVFPIGTIIFPKRGGAILTNKKRMTRVEVCCDLNVMGVIPSEVIDNIYLYQWFKIFDLSKVTSGSTVLQLNNCDIAPLKISLPPLALQQEFAAKVEAIESAKAEINAQIAEMQTLLASRMDYYFD